jgi:hypothetical protein
MAVTAKVYAHLPLHLAQKDVDLVDDAIKVALFTNVLAVTQATDEFFDAAPYTSNEVASGLGYTTGGAALTGNAVTAAALVTKFDATDPAWTATGAGFTFRYAVIYDDTPVSSKPLISYIDFGEDQVWAAAAHTIPLSASGIATITVA